MKFTYVLLATVISFDLQGQIPLLGSPKAEIEKKLSYDIGTGMIATDSTISYNLSTDPQGYIRVTCHFSREENCSMIIYSSDDAGTYAYYLDRVIEDPKYRWRKINGNQYVSKYRKKLLLETDPDPSKQAFRVLPAQWTRETYRTFTFD
jgi:hypothetical protein